MSLSLGVIAKWTADEQLRGAAFNVAGRSLEWSWVPGAVVAVLCWFAVLKLRAWAGTYRLEGRRHDSFPYQGGDGLVPPSQDPAPPERHD